MTGRDSVINSPHFALNQRVKNIFLFFVSLITDFVLLPSLSVKILYGIVILVDSVIRLALQTLQVILDFIAITIQIVFAILKIERT